LSDVAHSGGDGNGFETDPTNAYTDNGSSAVDFNSGTTTNTSCANAGKDSHRFYDYNFSLPGGSTITGIEVRLDAKVESAAGSPKMCVLLSWDGGATWTIAKSTVTLGTAEATYILGSQADTWGRTWSTADFSSSNFRVRVVNVARVTERDFLLDWIAVRVYYQ
jgi:hypothetical protein